MTLGVADIDRWDPEAVRNVFHAAKARAVIAQEAGAGLARLPAFQDWDGQTAQAARDAIGKTRVDLNAHGEEALAVARAADMAADGIENVRRRLSDLRQQARSLRMDVDPVTSTIVPGPDFRGPAVVLQANIATLQPELNAVVAEANLVDQELAHAINMADGKESIPEAGPPIKDGLPHTQIASDANQERLRRARAQTRAQLDDLQHRYDNAAAQVYMAGGPQPGTMEQMQALADQINATKGRLGEFDALTRALGEVPETYLTQLSLPNDLNQKVLAAVAVGNPDTASKIAVIVPGVGSTAKGSIESMVNEASHLRDTTMLQLERFTLPDSVSTIAWMGYDTPPNPLNTGSLTDAWVTMNDDLARKGASNLSSYLEQVHAANPNADVTLLGHSYGSLTSSLALQELHSEGVNAVDNAVFYGSPGLEITNADQLGLGPGHGYVMRAPGDTITEMVAQLSDGHGWGTDPYLHNLLPELSSQAGTSPDGVVRVGVDGHADYPRDGAPNVLRMSGYNFATVIAGIPQTQLVMAPPITPTTGLPPSMLGGG